MTQTIDFSRSFLTFRIDREKKPAKTQSHKARYTLNNARIMLESVCTVAEKEGDYRERFVHGASCKTERVGVEGDIWTEPNADFVPIFGATHFLCIKTFDQAGKQVSLFPPSLGMQPERQLEAVAEVFDQVPIVVETVAGEALDSVEKVVGDAVGRAGGGSANNYREPSLPGRDRVPGQDHQPQRAGLGLPDRHGTDTLPRPGGGSQRR